MLVGPVRGWAFSLSVVTLLFAARASPIIFDASQEVSHSRKLMSGHTDMLWMYLEAQAAYSHCECCGWECGPGWFQNNGTCWKCSMGCSADGSMEMWKGGVENKKYMSKMCNSAGNMQMDRVCTNCDYLASGMNLVSGSTGNCSSGYYKRCTTMNNTHCVACNTCSSSQYVSSLCDGSEFRGTVCSERTVCGGSYTVAADGSSGTNQGRTMVETPQYLPSMDYAASGYTMGTPATTLGTDVTCVSCPDISCTASTKYKACGHSSGTVLTGVTTNGNTSCVSCETCARDEYVSKACREGSDWQFTVCSKCTVASGCKVQDTTALDGASPTWLNGSCTGTSSDVTMTMSESPTKCVACKTHTEASCASYQYAKCTTTSDTVCTNCTTSATGCTAGSTWLDTSTCGTSTSGGFRDTQCVSCQSCRPSNGATTPYTFEADACTTTADRNCSDCRSITCSAGKFAVCGYSFGDNTGGDTTCETCTPCTSGTYLKEGCTGWSDSTCEKHKECTDEDGDDINAQGYRLTAGNLTHDTTCSTCQDRAALNCSATQRATCNTVDGNICKACSTPTCSAGHFIDASTCGGSDDGYRDTQCEDCTNAPMTMMPISPMPMGTDDFMPGDGVSNQDFLSNGQEGVSFMWTTPSSTPTTATGCTWQCKKGYYRMKDFCVICPRNTTTETDGATSKMFCQPITPPPRPTGVPMSDANIGADGMAPRDSTGRIRICPAIPLGAMDNRKECSRYYTDSSNACQACTTTCPSGQLLSGMCTNVTDFMCKGQPTVKSGETLVAVVTLQATLSITKAEFDASVTGYNEAVLKTAGLWDTATSMAKAGTTITSTGTAVARRSGRNLLQSGVTVDTSIETTDIAGATAAVTAINTAGESGLQAALAATGVSALASVTVSGFVPAAATFQVKPPPTTTAAPGGSNNMPTTTSAPGLSGASSLQASLLSVIVAALGLRFFHW